MIPVVPEPPSLLASFVWELKPSEEKEPADCVLDTLLEV